MKILVVGGGGREHAIVWKMAQEGEHEIFCAPGNAGIAELATCVPIKATDVAGMVELAKKEQFDLVCVTPDDPLALGMVDALQKEGIRAFGPNAAAARIEASKVFSKDLMKKYNIPTAAYEVFTDEKQAREYLRGASYPIVIKADGLALGKGVYICQDAGQADQAIEDIMVSKNFGEAGSQIVIEQFLTGPEVSLLCFCDGTHVALMPAAQDHKRAYDNDKGANTGGMGTFAPTQKFDQKVRDEVMERIVYPTLSAMRKEGCPFHGVLYFGLILTPQGIMVLEYNSRFGDPETQVILPLMQSSLIEAMEACIDGTLEQTEVAFSEEAAVCVVMASGGYPGKYQTGYPIEGLKDVQGDGKVVFHAGTKQENGKVVTSGGRVLGVTAVARDIQSARDKAYQMVEGIDFQQKHFRHDIGIK